MLTWLSVKNFALIESLEVEFDAGLNVITGETGAGKSIIIGAIQLLAGDRADRTTIRKDADSCEISGIFQLDESKGLLPAVNAMLQEAGLPACEAGQLLIGRVVNTKSSRSFINSSPATLQLVKQLGDWLVDLHGPYDNQSLLRPAQQLQLLDRYADNGGECARYDELYRRLAELRARQESHRGNLPSPAQMELLRFQIAEIDAAALRDDEDVELVRKHQILARARDVLELIDHCTKKIESDGGIRAQLADIIRELARLAEIDEATGGSFSRLAADIVAQTQSLAEEMGVYSRSFDVDPSEFAAMEERLAVIQRLKRKYGGAIPAVLRYRDELEEQVQRHDDFEQIDADLERQITVLAAEVLQSARILSRRRKESAKKLEKAVTAKLRVLGFAESTFSVEIVETAMQSTGIDTIEFFIAPNPGEGRQPLRNVASSGEISRVMLAIKAILAGADRIPSLVFDEIDVNIGGRVAVTVAEELARLGREHQILCITHLPQIAAAGRRHFVVEKSTKRARTATSIKVLDEPSRIEEIGRMLGGGEKLGSAATHAAELVRNATAWHA